MVWRLAVVCIVGSLAACTGRKAGANGTPDAATADLCAPLIGNWTSTIDDGATVMVGTQQIPISGTIDFTLSKDDQALADVVDFTGTATISFSGATIVQMIGPAASTTNDPKDSHCDEGLQLYGQASTALGVMDFSVDATIDKTVMPPTGSGTFTMKSDKDNGATASGGGGLHMMKKS